MFIKAVLKRAWKYKRDLPGFITATSPFPRLRARFEESYYEGIKDNRFLLDFYNRRKRGFAFLRSKYDRLFQEYRKSGYNEKVALFIFDIFYQTLLCFYFIPYIPLLRGIRKTIEKLEIDDASREQYAISRKYLDGFKSNFQVYLDITTNSASSSLYSRFRKFCQFFGLSQYAHVIIKAVVEQSREKALDKILTIDQNKAKNVGEDFGKKFQVIRLLDEDKRVTFSGKDELFVTTWFLFLSLSCYPRVFQCSPITYKPLREEMGKHILKGFGKEERLKNPDKEAFRVLMSKMPLEWLATHPCTGISEVTKVLRSLLAPGRIRVIDLFGKDFPETSQMLFNPAIFEEEK